MKPRTPKKDVLSTSDLLSALCKSFRPGVASSFCLVFSNTEATCPLCGLSVPPNRLHTCSKEHKEST